MEWTRGQLQVLIGIVGFLFFFVYFLKSVYGGQGQKHGVARGHEQEAQRSPTDRRQPMPLDTPDTELLEEPPAEAQDTELL